jgi:Protein of unknown function (DUF3800)
MLIYPFMVTLYLDESRHEDHESYMVVAGFWGKQEQWDALIPDWVSALGKKKALHMSGLRLGSKAGALRGGRLLGRLGPLPYKHGLTPIYTAVKTGDYLDIIANTPYAETMPGYAVCLTGVMQRLSRMVRSTESIKIFCEIQKSYEEDARRTFRQVSRTRPISDPTRPYFHSIEFISKDSSVLTQPSDFLAYALAEHHANGDSAKAKLCKPIFGNGGVVGLTLTREHVREIMTKLKFRDSRLVRSVGQTS